MPIRLHRGLVISLALALGLACIAIAAPLDARAQARAGTTPAPSRAQIRRAIHAAERSPDLWATVNICNTTGHPNTMGIRGQMPALGFPAELKMVFRVEYWSAAKQVFVTLPGVSQAAAVGRVKSGVHQQGASFTFLPHAGLLRGRVSFQWRLKGKLIGRVARLTRAGHSDADYGDPPGFSSWECAIP
jgi:hypothetical protein